MKNIFKIAKYDKAGNSFIKTGYDEYIITYIKSSKKHEIIIVVNSHKTNVIINTVTFNPSYKTKILLAIKEYLNNSCDLVSDNLTLQYVNDNFCDIAKHNINNYLLIINKEETRDKLTEVGLIKTKNL
jgi:hypothetical protein